MKRSSWRSDEPDALRPRFSRRIVTRLATSIVAVLLVSCRSAPVDETAPTSAPDAYLVAALRTADWLESVAIATDDGTWWPVQPGVPTDPTTPIDDTLYHGNPGVVLFFLEAHRATGNARYLEIARAGADGLLARLDARDGLGPGGAGLYTGIAGIGFVLEETHLATGDAKYRTGAVACLQRLADHAIREGEGVEWNDSTDIVSGSAGVGFFLLWAYERIPYPESLRLALETGRRLVQLGESAPGGTRWTMNPTFPRYMPNFSHGTAGVAAYLAALSEFVNERRFLDAAQSGASHLVRIADTDDGGCVILHHEPDGENLYYLGWCHGPVGTGRLFFELYEHTENPLWFDWMRRGAASLLNSGIPDSQTPGFWNNVGQCCGSAGVLEYYLDLHRETGNAMYLDAAIAMGDQVLAESAETSIGLNWSHAEHRARPEETTVQTGYMQGAAGIAIALLHLSAAVRDEPDESIRLPDSPFETGGTARSFRAQR